MDCAGGAVSAAAFGGDRAARGGAIATLPESVWQAALYSVAVSLGAVAVTLVLALPLALSHRKWIELVGLMGIASSPLVLGTGLYLMINPFIAPWDVALPVTAAVNAVMALPFALRILAPCRRADRGGAWPLGR